MLPVTVPQFLSRLRTKGITLSLVDGNISIKGPAESLTLEERNFIDARRKDLVLYFAAHAAVRQPSLMASGDDPVPAESQQCWWDWVRESPIELGHERITAIDKYENVSADLAQTAVKRVVERHATLRSCFQENGGKLFVTINAPELFAVETEMLDLALDSASAEALANERAKEFNRRPLYRDEQWQIRIKVISWSSHVVVALLLSHILIDGTSMELIRTEIGDILSGKDVTTSPPQFVDYAQWEQTWIHSESGAALIDYWKNWLGGQPALHTPSGTKLDWRHGRNANCFFTIPQPMRAKINARALEFKSSPFFLYLALYAVALARWSGQERLSLRCIGDLRRSRALAPVVGFMTCADPIEAQVPSGSDFASVLKFITAEYYNAAMLRLPSMLKFPAHPARPGIEKLPYTEAIAATINFMPDRKRSDPPPPENAGIDQDAAWPPVIQRAEIEEWPALLWPIYLRLNDKPNKTIGLFQFNEAIVSQEEQAGLMAHFFDAMAQVSGWPSGA